MCITNLGYFLVWLMERAQRYQTLLVGAGALWIAYQQMKIARSQSNISKTLADLTTGQRAAEAAYSIVTVDQVIRSAFEARHHVISNVYHSATEEVAPDGGPVWTWSPEALAAFAAVEIPSGLQEAAAKALPLASESLAHLAFAVSDAKSLAAEFAERPWLFGVVPADQLTYRDIEKGEQTDKVLNRIYQLLNALGPFQPHVRKVSAA